MSEYLIMRTKHAMQRRLQDLGLTRSQAKRANNKMTHEQRWAHLSFAKRTSLRWECRHG